MTQGTGLVFDEISRARMHLSALAAAEAMVYGGPDQGVREADCTRPGFFEKPGSDSTIQGVKRIIQTGEPG